MTGRGIEGFYVDETRLGVTGGSGGGLLTNWVVTQTTRFKAAVSQRDIADWANFWYTADFTLFTPTWFRKPPFQDPADFARRSPITYVEKIQTPLMFILGDEDWRTPPAAGGEDLFRALKYLSFTHSAIYTALLVVAIAGGHDDLKYVLGWAHGIGWIVMSLLCVDAVRRRVIPLWLGVMVAVVGGVGPFAGTIGFLYAERHAVSPAGLPQRDMV